MKKFIKIISLITMCLKHKKKSIKVKINKKQVIFLKKLLKVKIIKLIKKLKNDIHIILLNINFKLTIKPLIKKKKISINKKSKINEKNVYIISNSQGIDISDKRKTGLVLFKISLT